MQIRGLSGKFAEVCVYFTNGRWKAYETLRAAKLSTCINKQLVMDIFCPKYPTKLNDVQRMSELKDDSDHIWKF